MEAGTQAVPFLQIKNKAPDRSVYVINMIRCVQPVILLRLLFSIGRAVLNMSDANKSTKRVQAPPAGRAVLNMSDANE